MLTLRVLLMTALHAILAHSETLRYFEDEVVKLVDFVDTIKWIDFMDITEFTNNAKLVGRRKQELLLVPDSSATLQIASSSQYALIKSECIPDYNELELQFKTEQAIQEASFKGCRNGTWTFESTPEEVQSMTLRNRGNVNVLVKKIGVGNVPEEKTLGVLHEDGKRRLELLREEYSQSQILVAVLGLRGSGKSTLASLLSGNDQMFRQGRRSTRTTTLGIDISPIIPLPDYLIAVQKSIGEVEVDETQEVAPIIFTDSEGMGVRGDDIDFVATIPPLLFSNIIIWITTDSLRADEELLKLNRYLNLANKIQDDSGSLCSDFKAGKLLVVVNKMQGDESDEELTQELIEEETDSDVKTTAKRNEIRGKLKQCFQSVDVIGFPYLTLPDKTKSLQYEHISGEEAERFRESLVKVSGMIVNAKNERRVLAGTVISPKELPELFDLVLGKINTEAEFLDNELRDALYAMSVRNKLVDHEMTLKSQITELERSKKEQLEDFLIGMLNITAFHEDYKNNLTLETSNQRRVAIIEAEWNKVSSRIMSSMESSVSYAVSASVSSLENNLVKYSSLCKYLPPVGHRCIKANFTDSLRVGYTALLQLSPEINRRSTDTFTSTIQQVEEIFSECAFLRSSFNYEQLSAAQNLLRSGILLVSKMASEIDVNRAVMPFQTIQRALFKETETGSWLGLPCSVGMLLQKSQTIPRYLEAAFKRTLNVMKNRFTYGNRFKEFKIPFDFLGEVQKTVSTGKFVRVIDQHCDLPGIVASVPSGVEELRLICFYITAYGHITTKLRSVLIETAYFEISERGATLNLLEPKPPSKASDGVSGAKGHRGGNVIIKVHFNVTGGTLKVIANGGQGGDGGNGFEGPRGNPGPDGVIPPTYFEKSYYDSLGNDRLTVIHHDEGTCRRRKGCFFCKVFDIKENYVCRVTKTYKQQFMHYSTGAGAGGQGNPGFQGAKGGIGGDPGRLLVDVVSDWAKHFVLSARGGVGGAGGRGGEGGRGGIGGQNTLLELTYTRVWEWRENHHDKMLSSGISLGERVTGREADGEKGMPGSNGEQGAENKLENVAEFSKSYTFSPLFTLFKQIYAFRNQGDNKKYEGERSIPRLITHVESLLRLLILQKEALSRLQSQYTTHSIGLSIEPLVKSEANLADQLMQAYKSKQDALVADSDRYKTALRVIDEQIEQFNTGSLKRFVDRLVDELLKNSQSNLADGIKQVEEYRKSQENRFINLLPKIFAVVNIASGVVGNYPGAVTGLIGLFSSTQSLFKQAKKRDLKGLRDAYKNITDDLQEIKGAVESFVGDVTTLTQPKPQADLTDIHAVFDDYFTAVTQSFQTSQALTASVKSFVASLQETGIKDQIQLGIDIHELMKAYSPSSLSSEKIEIRFKRHEVQQLISKMKSALLDLSSQLGSENVLELDLLQSQVEMKADIAEKLIETINEIADIQLSVDGLSRRQAAMLDVSRTTVNSLEAAFEVLDQIVSHSTLNLLSTGKEIHSGINQLIQIATHVQQANTFLEKIPPLVTWSSPQVFSSAMEILKVELGSWKGLQEATVHVTLDEIDFPYEFSLLRRKKTATFPIIVNEQDELWIENVKASMINSSGSEQDFTVLVRHLGTRFFNGGDDLKLPSVVFESTYSNPGPVWKSLPKTIYNTVDMVNYPLASYFQIEIPENYKTLNLISNVNMDTTPVFQIVLEFKVWYKKY